MFNKLMFNKLSRLFISYYLHAS